MTSGFVGPPALQPVTLSGLCIGSSPLVARHCRLGNGCQSRLLNRTQNFAFLHSACVSPRWVSSPWRWSRPSKERAWHGSAAGLRRGGHDTARTWGIVSCDRDYAAERPPIFPAVQIGTPALTVEAPALMGLDPMNEAEADEGEEDGVEDEVEEMEEEEDEEAEADLLSQRKHLHVTDSFLDPALASKLRAVFDDRFMDPRHTTGERFVWDYWHVERQYTLLRTFAGDFFPKKAFRALEDALKTYGETQLGCRRITPMWISYYIDGCRQELHCDNPHGPWAFVLSLTPWQTRRFRGGETMILDETVLDFWRGFSRNSILEMDSLVQLVEPEFNRLTVFDPRFPHGVRMVEGVRDPRDARVVLHGWFTDPAPIYRGGLSEKQAAPALNAMLEGLYKALEEVPRAMGTLTVRITISATDGTISNVDWLTDTLIPDPAQGDIAEVRDEILCEIIEHLARAKFPTAKKDTEIIVPFTFD